MATKKTFGELTLSQINEKHPRLMYILVSTRTGFGPGLNYVGKLDMILLNGKESLRVFYNKIKGASIHGMSYLIHDTDARYCKRVLNQIYSDFGGEEKLLIAEANARYPKGTKYKSLTPTQFVTDSKIASKPMKDSGNVWESENANTAFIYTQSSLNTKMTLITMSHGHGFVYGKLKNHPVAVEMWAEPIKTIKVQPNKTETLLKVKAVTKSNLQDTIDEITKLQKERLELVEKLAALDTKIKTAKEGAKKLFDDTMQGIS